MMFQYKKYSCYTNYLATFAWQGHQTAFSFCRAATANINTIHIMYHNKHYTQHNTCFVMKTGKDSKDSSNSSGSYLSK